MCVGVTQDALYAVQTARLQQSITTSRTSSFLLPYSKLTRQNRTSSRKNLTTVAEFIAEPDSRAQCVALEENVREFGLTYFGMKDKRQGIVHIIGPEQGFTVSLASIKL